MSTPDATLAWMAAWRGFTEGPRPNEQPFDDIAGHDQDLAWCATGRVAAHLSTAVAIPPGGASAYTPSNYQAYRRAGLLLDLRHDRPQPGDLFWLGYARFKGVRLEGIGHEGTVREVIGDTLMVTEEANANAEGSRTGGQWASLRRDWSVVGRSWVVGFARPPWDGVVPKLVNLPRVAEHTRQIMGTPIIQLSQLPPVLAAGQLVVDGQLGPATITRWQQVLGTPADGVIDRPSELVRAVQRHLNHHVRAGLRVDGLGIAQDGRRYATVAALQGYLGSARDGRLDHPVSAAVMALQERLNGGRF